MLVDRKTGRIAMIVSTEGGMDIEEVAHATPGKDHARSPSIRPRASSRTMAARSPLPSS